MLPEVGHQNVGPKYSFRKTGEQRVYTQKILPPDENPPGCIIYVSRQHTTNKSSSALGELQFDTSVLRTRIRTVPKCNRLILAKTICR